jgi:alkanesulfonate monooxygenase SsuD/methylene tetrahydromethanopterin reductase-like flavin-dependent oxidoreductase (luciferase family)
MSAFVTRYDFRAPGEALGRQHEMFARCLDQVGYIEQHGQSAIVLSEHHASDDGYLPSPLIVASAVAARTSTISISVAALIANLHDPLRMAEDIAVLDHLANGRISFTIGLGYRPEEYAMFGRAWETRGADVETAITVMRQAWTGESFEHGGRTVRVLPTPYSPGGPVLFYGGGSKVAARRAARLGLHFQPPVADPALRDLNVEFWAENGKYLLAEARGYNAWHNDFASLVRDSSDSVEEMRTAGVYVVETPEDLIAKCIAREIRVVSNHPLCGGMPEEPSWESLRLVCEKVMPAVKVGVATAKAAKKG